MAARLQAFTKRLLTFLLLWGSYFYVSGMFYMNFIDDVGGTFWSGGLLAAIILLFLSWLILDVICASFNASMKQLWKILWIFTAVNFLLCPLWVNIIGFIIRYHF